MAIAFAVSFLLTNQNQRIERSEMQVVEASSRLLAQDALASEHRLELKEELRIALDRVSALEARSRAAHRAIAAASPAVLFVQGAFGFQGTETGQLLRYVPGPDGAPTLTPLGPAIALGAAGPIVEKQFTGTAFVATEDRLLITNRHVVLPWEHDDAAQRNVSQGFVPVMLRLSAYLPGMTMPLEVELVHISEEADVAILRSADLPDDAPYLELSENAPRPGDPVIVMGYPTGMRALLARAGRTFVEGLVTGDSDFWRTGQVLADHRLIRPLATRGIVGEVTPTSVVYDASTARGGSGGPVLALDGRLLAISSAVVPEFDGANLGVPLAPVRRLLDSLPDDRRFSQPIASITRGEVR